MHEKIEHCLYQAGLTAQGCWDELDDYARQGIEKFAELIVRECVIRAEREWIRNGSDTEHNKAITSVIKSIKDLFGVEE